LLLILKVLVKQNLVTRLLNNLRFTAHTLSTYESCIKQPSDDTHNQGCPSRTLKRFPRDTEGILQEIQGRLIVPVEVDGHCNVRDTTRGSSRSTDSARHSTWRQSVSKLSRYNESFPSPGTSRLLWAVLSVDIVLPVSMLILRYYVARGKTKCTMRVAMQPTIPSVD